MQAIFMSFVPFKFCKVANMCEIFIWYCFLNYNSLIFLRLNLSTWNFSAACLLTQLFPKFFNAQILISTTVSSPERLYIKLSCQPSCCLNYQTNYSYSVEHNTVFLKLSCTLHVCYMFQPFFRPSSCMAVQKSHKGRCNKIKSKGLLVYSHHFFLQS